MSIPAMSHSVLFAAIRRDHKYGPNRAVQAAVGDYEFCVAQIERWGNADGRNFVLGPLVDLIDYFVDLDTPEAKELMRQAAAFERAGAGNERQSLDAQAWLRSGGRTDWGVLMRMAELAVAQGALPEPVGERLQAEIAWVLRASERAH